MQVFRLLLAALAGWTAIGILGTALAWATGDRPRAWRSLAWLGGVWLVYLAILLGVSERQKQRAVPRGQEECFDKMCFSVTEVVEVGEPKGEGAGRLLRVGVQVRNTGEELLGAEGLRGYLVDIAGGKWEETRGVGGVLLTARLPARGATLSQPVFHVAEGTKVSGLVLTREHTGWSWLVIGDTDSIRHSRTVLRLE